MTFFDFLPERYLFDAKSQIHVAVHRWLMTVVLGNTRETNCLRPDAIVPSRITKISKEKFLLGRQMLTYSRTLINKFEKSNQIKTMKVTRRYFARHSTWDVARIKPSVHEEHKISMKRFYKHTRWRLLAPMIYKSSERLRALPNKLRINDDEILIDTTTKYLSIRRWVVSLSGQS